MSLTFNAAPQFTLVDRAATLHSLTPRKEKHGDDTVKAFSMRLVILAGNTLLDAIDPGLRASLYMRDESQADLPGVEATTPLLRARVVEKLALRCCYEGWTLRIPYGFEDDEMVFSSCKVDAFTVTPAEGGSIELSMRVGTSDVDEEEFGRLFGLLGDEVTVTLTPPPKAEDVIDGTTEGYEREQAERQAEDDATDLFIAAGAEAD